MVVFAEYSWIPGNLRQAEDRAHRIGQTTSVNVYYLHVRSSVDDIMWAKIQSKLENVGQVHPLIHRCRLQLEAGPVFVACTASLTCALHI